MYSLWCCRNNREKCLHAVDLLQINVKRRAAWFRSHKVNEGLVAWTMELDGVSSKHTFSHMQKKVSSLLIFLLL